MDLIKTVIVDDSAFVRKAVREMLSRSPKIEVVGFAKNGREALEVVAALKPSVVTCDLRMPELDGLGFVRAQMAVQPLPILVLSSSSLETALVVEALEAGAVDFVQKPSALANEQLLSIREELIAKVKAAAQVPQHLLGPKAPSKSTPLFPASSKNRFDIVVLGVSTGGPQALRYLLPQFASGFPVPLAIVLHMPVGYTAMFAERLNELCQLPVREAFEGCELKAGEVLLAAAGQHLSFVRTAWDKVLAHLSTNPTDKPHRPSVDVLFESAAKVYGSRVLGVVMTGMGDDGKEGAAWIKAQGGVILTEAEETCVIYGMPRSIVEAQLTDAKVPLGSLATEITNRL